MENGIQILTSAAIGAAVSAVLTIAGTLLAQSLERGARKRELILTKAIDLARWKNDRTMQVASVNKRSARLDDEIYVARALVEDLDRLFTSGKLTAKSERYYESEISPGREDKPE
ncbi:MAG: hypothetical protein M3O50_01885 [Myxococcota bacterium]|nr:hypothetical protein [Myxococcota bacterium]